MLAAGQGLEPQYTGPKPVVLPLDEPALYLILYFGFSRTKTCSPTWTSEDDWESLLSLFVRTPSKEALLTIRRTGTIYLPTLTLP